MVWKKLGLVVLAALLLTGCARKEKLVVVLEWHEPISATCEQCQKCGVLEAEVRRACAELQTQLAAKGIQVEFTKKKPAGEGEGPGGLKVCDIPLDIWLGADVMSTPCAGCPTQSSGRQVMHRALQLDGLTYEIVPADLVVRAGLSAADELVEHNGQINAAEIKARACAKCPSGTSCEKSATAR